MAWTANIISKELKKGAFNVTLEFTDGSRTFSENYCSVQPTGTWIPDIVRNRIDDLEVAGSFDIPIGPISPSVPVLERPPVLPYFYDIPSQVHVAASNVVHWDLFNAHSSLLIRVTSIKQIPDIATPVTGIAFAWKLARTTNVGTGGVLQTAWVPDSLQTVLASEVTCRSKPTGGATESNILKNYRLHSEETNAGTLVITSMGGLELVPQNTNSARYEKSGILLRKNEGLRCVQITNSSAGNTGWLISLFTE